MRKRQTLAAIAALGLIVGACDDGVDDTDAGLGGAVDMDTGVDDGDTGVEMDTGVDEDTGPGDAGPPPSFQIRLVHNLPGLTGTAAAPGSAHLCLWVSAGGGAIAATKQFLTEATGPIPFRGVSSYVTFPVVAPADYLVGVYEPDAVMTDGCPDDPEDAAAPAARLLATIGPDSVPADSFSSAILSGFATGTFGAADDALPDLCNPAPDPAPFDETCTAEVAAQLIVQPDPQTEPGADMALIRVSQQLPNISPVPFNVCYEPTLAPNPSGPPGSCTDTDPGDTAETLFALVGYGSTTDYTERAPIVPTNPLAGFGGAIYLVADASGTRGCPRFTDLAASEQSCLPILAMFPSPPPSDNIQPQLEAGHRTTLFINGAFGLSGDDAMNFGPSMFMWQDNFVAE